MSVDGDVDRTFEAIFTGWYGTAVDDGHPDADRVRTRAEALSASGVDVAVVSELEPAEIAAQLGARPPGPGRLFLCCSPGSEVAEVGPAGPELRWRGLLDDIDGSESVRWVLADLWARGVGPGLVLTIGEELEGAPSGAWLRAGPERLLEVLDEQLARRRDRRVPGVDEDPRWSIEFPDGKPEELRVRESIMTVAGGSFGTRGALEERPPGASPMVVAAGVYDGGGDPPKLLAGPEWTRLDVETRGEGRRILDLRTGVVWREAPTASGTLRTVRFASLHTPGIAGLRAEAPAKELKAPDAPIPPWSRRGHIGTASVTSVRGGGIAAASTSDAVCRDDLLSVDRLVSLVANHSERPSLASAREALQRARRRGFDRMLAEHRAAWAQQWDDAHVVIEGDPESELAVRFALFHLISSASPSGEAAVGARGLSGPAYDGHVFWDADVYALPTLAAIAPERARAMLEYRIRRLPAARALARERGLRGARFPWESADDGTEVTPRWIHDGQGRRIRVHTGDHEDHIVADVAWAAARYSVWTGDEEFLRGAGRPLLEDASRYWVSQIRSGADGRAHIFGVVGPDEYHEIVDDNAYTNVMARWTLREAAEIHRQPTSAEPAEWRALADALVDGYDPATGLYEQFAGFYDLDPVLISEVADVPVAADLLLGRERVARSQIVKQADVLMLHCLVPDEVAPGSLEPNLDFYGPRTAHGSSLSPAIHARLLARAGRSEEALDMFRIAARLDLDDLTGTTAGGLHIATMGGVWQALAHGFLGIGVDGGRLRADPRLPASWRRVELTFRYRGDRVRVHAIDGRADIEVEAGRSDPGRKAGPALAMGAEATGGGGR